MADVTPTPWAIVPTGGIFPGVRPRYEIQGKGERVGTADGIGNARLIAAAPELLEALQACETALAPVMANHECGDQPPSGRRCGECLGCMNWATWTTTRAAITKALGQSIPFSLKDGSEAGMERLIAAIREEPEVDG